ncbi:hypothetical protein Nepgr_003282 [Nepenthes gracilis]|uniref:Cytochrome P450 n=1 Tax=Nepenthes gracilis TaxID=150966 RepID=A0AAD3RZ92_NEPGR|nr:hypothetical protein Nepgr_003282 [Nepenthes gracilis]
MEETWQWLYPPLFLLSLFLLFKFLTHLLWKSPNPKKLPPSPLAFPIIGHLHHLKEPLPQTLHNLSLKYGPIFSLLFGSCRVVVIESPSLIQECFSGKNDVIFANRPFQIVSKHIGYNFTIVGNAPYGEHWRRLRMAITSEIFSPYQLSRFTDVRREEVKELLGKLYQKSRQNSSTGKANVELRPLSGELVFNVLVRMLAGKKYCGRNFEEATEFMDMVYEIHKHATTSNLVDFIPILRLIDYQGFEKRIKKFAERVDTFLQSLITEIRTYNYKHTIIDHLLSLQQSESEFYSDVTIKGFVVSILIVGHNTTSNTIEWVMSLLLNHPEELSKARSEIDTHIGDDRLIEESDLPKLQYLNNIIFETLRLDPNLWEDPTTFKPERFQGVDVDVCYDYKYIPFGVGRRACPGEGLASRVIRLALASLIQCFEWERISEEKVDMTEGTEGHFNVFVHGNRNAKCIIIALRSAFDFIDGLVRDNTRFLFVNTHPLFDKIVDQMNAEDNRPVSTIPAARRIPHQQLHP